MPAVKVSRRRSPAWVMVLLVLALVSIAGIVIAAVHLASGGTITVPFTNPPKIISFTQAEQPKPWSPPSGTIAVPMSARDISAYTDLGRDDVWDVKNQRMFAAYLDPADVPAGAITSADQIVGRVLRRDKPAGYIFTESDFLPKGTRAGLVAGIPAGRRAMRLPLDKVRGLYGLRPGDRFDLVSTLAVEDNATAEVKRLGGPVGDRLALESSLLNTTKRAAVRVIVQNGTVVSAVQTNQIPVSVATLSQGHVMRTRPIQEVVVAVRPEEVSPLAEAMGVEADLAVVPRSGRPDDDVASITPDLIPRTPFDEATGDAAGATGATGGKGLRLIETIDGSNREVVPVPKSTGGAQGR